MDEHLIDEIIKVLLIFAVEAFEHENAEPNEPVKYTHHVNVGTLRRARSVIKELEKLRTDKRPFEEYRIRMGKVFTP